MILYIYIYYDIYIYIHYVNHQFDFQNCEPPKKEFACSPTLQWWTAPQWSGQGTPWETTSTWWWENHESYVFLWFSPKFYGKFPPHLSSSLWFIHTLMLSVKTTSSHNLVSMKIRFLSPITVFWLQFDRRSFSLPPKVWPFTSYKCL